MPRYPFHLSIPVADLEIAQRFYIEVLGATPGLVREGYLNVLLWGHQITLQHKPDEVRASKQQGSRHFGVILPWEVWEREAARLTALNLKFLSAPKVLKRGRPDEQAKLFLEDPSHNVIEVKAYRDVAAGVGGDGWDV